MAKVLLCLFVTSGARLTWRNASYDSFPIPETWLCVRVTSVVPRYNSPITGPAGRIFGFSRLRFFSMTRSRTVPRDPNTLSNYNDFLTTHTVANFNIDFLKARLVGSIILILKSLQDGGSSRVVLDTSFLKVDNVQVNGRSTQWELQPRSEPYGSALDIHLGQSIPRDQSLQIHVRCLRSQFPSFSAFCELSKAI